MINFEGTWILVQRENYEEYVLAVWGMKIKKKKIKKGKVKQIIRQEGNIIKTIEELKVFGNIVEMKNDYIADGMTKNNTKILGLNGFKNLDSISSFKDDKFIVEGIGAHGEFRIERFLENEMLVQVETFVPKNISTKFYYQKQ
ncbi:MAG: hypothetical protein ACFFBP_03960 [Promethearchaeota archaeon]